jgi:hypothetical protein
MTTFDEFIADLTEALAPRAPDAVAELDASACDSRSPASSPPGAARCTSPSGSSPSAP